MAERFPELLTTISGETIRTAEDFECFKKPELKALFSAFEYGEVPKRKLTGFEISAEEILPYAEKKTVQLDCEGFRFEARLYLPLSQKSPVPAFIQILNLTEKENPEVIRYLAEMGFASAFFSAEAVVTDKPEPTGLPEKDETGVLSCWGWAFSRILDYLEKEPQIDAEKVAIVGHSRGGKTTLWAFANDPRFFLCVANNSGCGGASLHRGTTGERVADITKNFGYWFCKKFADFSGREEMLPFDQHELMALSAPRRLYITSATEDAWACPGNEVDAIRMASAAYPLYGKKGAVLPKEIETGVYYHEGNIAYHRREGKHDMTLFDWQGFAEYFKTVL